MMNLKYNRLLLALVATMAVGLQNLSAQSNGGVNSSYSRYGLGELANQSQGFNRSMGGVAQGLRGNNRVNILNPASYSAMDSLTFLFDVGMSLRQTRMTQNDYKEKFNSTTFDYVTASFRIRRGLGMTVGFLPYSNIGYSFYQMKAVAVDDYANQSITQQLNYEGSGGLHEAFIGAGWMPFKGLSIGTNIGLLWGTVNNQMTQIFAENGSSNTSSYSSMAAYYNASIVTWKGDIGIQYQTLLNSKNQLTLGATVGIGHKIGNEATMLRTTLNGDTIQRSTHNGYELPMTYSVGAAWEFAQRLTVASDFTYEQWGRCTTPQLTGSGVASRYVPSKGEYKNRFIVNGGVEYVPARYDHSFLYRINYRVGGYYSSPYQVINGIKGPKEFGLSAGFGIPITNAITNRSYVNLYAPTYINIGFQWSRRKASYAAFIDEDVFRINVGITFNESWFMKWKFR